MWTSLAPRLHGMALACPFGRDDSGAIGFLGTGIVRPCFLFAVCLDLRSGSRHRSCAQPNTTHDLPLDRDDVYRLPLTMALGEHEIVDRHLWQCLDPLC